MIEPYRKYPQLLVGEIIIDHLGIEWKRTNIRNIKSLCDDNYYYLPVECYCDIDVGGGYTYSDEHGDCDHCIGAIRQIRGHNTDLTVEALGFVSGAFFDEEMLFDETQDIGVYLDEKDYEYKVAPI